MKYALVRAISSQPKGSPSLEDIWFFIPLVIAMGISLALFFILKVTVKTAHLEKG